MSASIYYKIVKPPEGHIEVWAPSSFVESMNKAFGNYPWILGATNLSKLEGMAACCNDAAKSKRNPYQHMIDLIITSDGEYCTIEVWPEY